MSSYLEKLLQDGEHLVTLSNKSKFKGKFPDIPLPENIDLQELTDGNLKPTFVTLPIMEIGSVAQGGMVFDRNTVEGLVELMNEEIYSGNFGHQRTLMDDFPLNAIFWVGSMIDEDGVAWAKGYLWNSEDAQYVKTLRSLNKWVETSFVLSIDWENMAFSEDGDTFTAKKPKEMRLLALDLVPEERAALQFEDRGQMELTTQSKTNHKEKEKKEMNITMSDIPDELKAEIIQQYEAESLNAKRFQELQSKYETQGVTLNQLKEENEKVLKQAMDMALEVAISQSIKIQSPALKNYIVALSKAENFEDTSQVSEFVQNVVASDEFIQLSSAIILEQSGGRSPSNGRNVEQPTDEEIVEGAEKAAKELGVKHYG